MQSTSKPQPLGSSPDPPRYGGGRRARRSLALPQQPQDPCTPGRSLTRALQNAPTLLGAFWVSQGLGFRLQVPQQRGNPVTALVTLEATFGVGGSDKHTWLHVMGAHLTPGVEVFKPGSVWLQADK